MPIESPYRGKGKTVSHPTKRIRNRFEKNCRRCKQSIPAGTEVFWRKGYGITHIACPDGTASKLPASDHIYFVEWPELKSSFLAFVKGDDSQLKREYNRNMVRGWINGIWAKDDGWTGATLESMRVWLASGYQVEGLKLSPDLVPMRERRKLKFTDDGDLSVDLALSGADYPFLQWERRPHKPGMQLNVSYQFNSHTPKEVVRDYAVWLARATYAIEAAGYDLEINVIARVRNLFRDRRMVDTVIRVKREMELSDFSQWSPLFSPGGFRMLVFYADVRAADHFNVDVEPRLGQGAQTDWRLDWNNQTRSLDAYHADGGSKPFPEAEFTTRLSEILN
jgi:hypothetical protein